MSAYDDLASKARALTAINKAKHKAEGYMYRVQMNIYDRRGYKETKVYYFKYRPADTKIIGILMEYGSTVLSDYKLEEL